jgi:hypothetical protein
MTDVKRIESYGLSDFCQDIEAAFKEGYAFDFDTNENFPTAFGTMLTCGLVKANKKVEKTETETETNTGIVAQDVQPAEIVQDTAQVTTEVEEVVQEVEQVTEETPETKEPAKRGPKPKNK